MPLMLKVSTNPDPQGLFLCGGLMYGYFLFGKVRNYQDGTLVSAYDYSPSDNTHRSQFSAALGIGHERALDVGTARPEQPEHLRGHPAFAHNVVYSLQVAWRFHPIRKGRRNAALKEDDQN
ncbi:MAG: hypothetical protein IPI95_05425 [Flavobacteriales bacterium]|nr:hypothetical protein [Flavobacteriales bacterium]